MYIEDIVRTNKPSGTLTMRHICVHSSTTQVVEETRTDLSPRKTASNPASLVGFFFNFYFQELILHHTSVLRWLFLSNLISFLFCVYFHPFVYTHEFIVQHKSSFLYFLLCFSLVLMPFAYNYAICIQPYTCLTTHYCGTTSLWHKHFPEWMWYFKQRSYTWFVNAEGSYLTV